VALHRAAALFAQHDDPAGEANARRRLANAALFQSDLDTAASELSRALALSRRARHLRIEALVLYGLGLVERHRNAPTLAEAFFRQALHLHRQMGDFRLEATITGYLGLVVWDQGRMDDAVRVFGESAEFCRRSGDTAGRASALSAMAAAQVEAQQAEVARSWLQAELDDGWAMGRDRALLNAAAGLALHALGRRDEAVVRYQVAVPTLELAKAWAQSTTLRALWAIAGISQDEGRKVLAEGAATVPETAEHPLLVALAHQVVERGFVDAALRDQVAGSARGYARILLQLSDEVSGAARVAADGSWFQTPASGRVDLGRRRVLRRLLAVLATHHVEKPGQTLTLRGLFEAAWPGEHGVEGSADARVYVGISTLRKLGLRDALITHSQRDPTGYALHETVTVAD
jgi:tetratricopeptide (TPR) repeat protein